MIEKIRHGAFQCLVHPQKFAHAPGLGKAPAGGGGVFAVVDFGQLAHAALPQGGFQGGKPVGHLLPGGGAVAIHFQVGQVNVEECANPENQVESTDEYKTIQQLLAETEAAKAAAATSASAAAKSAQEAKDAAAQAAADAKKVIDEGVNDKLQQMQKIQTDVTAKANKVSTDAAKVEGYAKAAQYLIGYNKKNILTVFLYEE